MNGPEPIVSWICWSAGVSATRFGIMNGTFDEILPIESRTMPYGCFSVMTKVLAPCASSLSTTPNRRCPMGSRLPQRINDATQSSPVTGVLSCHANPSRSVNA